MPALIVGYYTEGYMPEAHRLKASLDKLSLEYHLERLPDVGHWKANAHLRPWFLADMRMRFADTPLLSLDVDCVVYSDPIPYLTQLDCDLAVHSFGDHERLPGTLWLRPTDQVDELIKAWCRRNSKKPGARDIENFNAAFRDVPNARVSGLPPEYCYIFDMSRERFPGVTPVIEHFQASRAQ